MEGMKKHKEELGGWMCGRVDGLEGVSNLVGQLQMDLWQRQSESGGKGQYGCTTAASLAAASYSALQPQHMMENPSAACVCVCVCAFKKGA